MCYLTKQMILNKNSKTVEGVGTPDECKVLLEEIRKNISFVCNLEAASCKKSLIENLKKLSDSYVIVDMPTDSVEDTITKFFNTEKEILATELRELIKLYSDPEVDFSLDEVTENVVSLRTKLVGNFLVEDFIETFLIASYYSNPEERDFTPNFMQDYIKQMNESTSYV